MNAKNCFLALVFTLSAASAHAAGFPTFECTDEEGVPLSISVVGNNPRMGFLATATQGRGAFQNQYQGEYLNGENRMQFFLETERTTENQYSQLDVQLEVNFPEQTAHGSYRATGPFGDERSSNIHCQIKR